MEGRVSIYFVAANMLIIGTVRAGGDGNGNGALAAAVAAAGSRSRSSSSTNAATPPPATASPISLDKVLSRRPWRDVSRSDARARGHNGFCACEIWGKRAGTHAWVQDLLILCMGKE